MGDGGWTKTDRIAIAHPRPYGRAKNGQKVA